MLEHNFAKCLLKFSSFSLLHPTHTAEILSAALQLFLILFFFFFFKKQNVEDHFHELLVFIEDSSQL